MSFLINESHAKNSKPLWMPYRVGQGSTEIVQFVPVNPVLMPGNGASAVIGTFTFPRAVTFASLRGWLNLNADSSGSTETPTCSLFLSPSGTSLDNTKTDVITNITLTASSGGANNYILLDNMYYYGVGASTTTLNLCVKMTSAHSNTDNLHPGFADGSVPFSSLPTANSATWTLTAGKGKILAIATTN